MAKPPLKRALWKALRSDSLGGLHFRRQQVIAGFIVNFYCASARVAIELDRPIHQNQADDDETRDRAMAEKGIRTIRIFSERVRDSLPAVLEQIGAACRPVN